MKLLDVKEASRTLKKSKHSIDKYHKEFQKQCWVSNENLDLLVDFDRYSELFENRL